MFLLAFSLISKASYENISKKVSSFFFTLTLLVVNFTNRCHLEDFDNLVFVFAQWIPELRHYAPNVPIVLVGTKLGTISLFIR